MSKDILEKIDELGTTWNQFKKEIETRQAELEKKGHADPVLIEKIEKMSVAMADMDAQKTELETQQKLVEKLKARTDEMEQRLNTPTSTGGKSDGHKTVTPDEVRKKQLEYIRTGKRGACEYVNEQLAEHAKSLNLTVSEEGGVFYSVTHDTDIQPLVQEITPMRQIATVVNISTSEYSGMAETGELECGWVGEQEDREDTDGPTFAELTIPVHEVYAQPMATTKMLEDSEYDIEGQLNMLFARGFAKKENVGFITGNGKKQPRGLLTYPTSLTPSGRQILHVVTGASGAWASTDPHLVLLGLPEKLEAEYRANSRWLMSRARLAEVMAFVDGNKLPIWQPSFQLGTPSNLVGFPVQQCEDMPAKAANSLSVAFGDFKRGYKIIARRGLVVLRDPLTKKGWVKFYATARVGGDVADTEAYLALKFA